MPLANSTNRSTLLGLFLTAFFCGCGDNKPAAPPQSAVDQPESVASESSQPTFLPEDMRRRVWDIEHLGFVIEQKIFPKLKTSLNTGDLQAWEECLSGQAQVTVPTNAAVTPRSVLGNTAHIVQARFDAIDHDPAGTAEFLEWFQTVRDKFDDCKSSMGLVRLIPDQHELTGTWKAVWRIRIAGHKNDLPIEVQFELDVHLTELGDDIGDRREFIESVHVRNWNSLDASQTYLSNVTDASGLLSDNRYDNWHADTFVPNTGGVYVTDYDLDGHLDVLVDDFRDGNRLYKGSGDGTFIEVTKQAGIDPGGEQRLWTLSCWIDIDNDSDDDLIIEDRLYENLGDGTFADATEKCNLPLTPAAGYAVADYDADGLLDLYVCHTSAYRVGQSEQAKVKWIDDGHGINNVLYRNLGDWQFQDVTDKTNAGGNGSSCFAAVWLHVNDDNRPDLFAINEFGINSLLLSTQEGTFQESDVDPVFGGFSMGVASGDYDNDGQSDLYVANMYSKAGNRILANIDQAWYPEDLYRKIDEGTRGSKLYKAQTDTTFSTIAADDMIAYVGWAYGPTFVDLDNDGWLDIYATAGFKSEERGKPDG